MAGLACARELTRRGLDVVVLEASERVGGRVDTRDINGFAVDVGAGFLSTFHHRTMALVEETGLTADLLPLPARAALLQGKNHFLLRLRSLSPVGGIVPLRAWPGLIRMLGLVMWNWSALDPAEIIRAEKFDDISAAEYGRQLPAELVSRLLGPAIRGFLYWDADSTSKAMLLVLLRAAVSMRRLQTLRRGLESLPDAMSLDVSVRVGCRVRGVKHLDGRWHTQFDHQGGHGQLESDRLVLATPAHVTADLLGSDVHASVRAMLESTVYAAAVTVSHGVPQPAGSDVAATFVAGDAAVPPAAGAPLTRLVVATSVSGSTPQLARADGDVVTFYGKVPDTDDAFDSAVGQLLIEAGRLVPQYPASGPVASVVAPWPHAVPRFPPGRLRTLRAVDHVGLARTGLALAGDYLCGPSIEGAVQSGQQAAQRLAP